MFVKSIIVQFVHQLEMDLYKNSTIRQVILLQANGHYFCILILNWSSAIQKLMVITKNESFLCVLYIENSPLVSLSHTALPFVVTPHL